MSLLKPNMFLDTIFDITPEWMRRAGLRGLLLDLDNTLIPYKSYHEAPLVQRWAQDLLAAGIQLRILSNAMPKRVSYWSGLLRFPGVGLASKPMPVAFLSAINQMGLQPAEVGMVGDQLFTDILGGNLIGAYTIMVTPLSDNALPHTKLTRKVERLVLRRYRIQR